MPEQFVNQRTYHKPLFICNLFLVSPVTAITGERIMANIYFCSAHSTVLLAFFGLWHKACNSTTSNSFCRVLPSSRHGDDRLVLVLEPGRPPLSLC